MQSVTVLKGTMKITLKRLQGLTNESVMTGPLIVMLINFAKSWQTGLRQAALGGSLILEGHDGLGYDNLF